MVAVDVRFAAVSAGTLKALGFNFSKLGGDIQGALAAPDSLGGVSLPNTGVPAPFDLDITAPIQSAFNLILSNPANGITGVRSEERRVGTEWVSKCRTRWYPYHSKQKKRDAQGK